MTTNGGGDGHDDDDCGTTNAGRATSKHQSTYYTAVVSYPPVGSPWWHDIGKEMRR